MTPFIPRRPAIAVALLAVGLAGVRQADVPFRPGADRHGALELPAEKAGPLGERLRLEGRGEGRHLAGWDDVRDRVAWTFEAPRGGFYLVLVEYAAPPGRGGASFDLVVGDRRRQGFVHETGGEATFLPQPILGPVLLKAGVNRLEIVPRTMPNGLVMNLRRVRLVPDRDGD